MFDIGRCAEHHERGEVFWSGSKYHVFVSENLTNKLGSLLAPCFCKSIKALSVFLSSAAGMHSWKLIFTLNLTSFTRHGHFKVCRMRKSEILYRSLSISLLNIMLSIVPRATFSHFGSQPLWRINTNHEAILLG